METRYKPLTIEQLPDRIAYLEDQLSDMNDELQNRRQELAELRAPFKPGNIVSVNSRRWNGDYYEDFIQHWHIDRILPPRWKGADFRLYGRVIKKDLTLGIREREITSTAAFVDETLEAY